MPMRQPLSSVQRFRPFAPLWWSERVWAVGLAGAVILGALLRLVWVMDIEYKGDEAWTFERTQQVGRTELFPWVGMPSSTEILTPGMSLWVFLALSKLFAAQDPPSLARAVQLLNVCAIALLVLFALGCVPKEEREPWLWAAALVSVNPLAVLFHRKIWPPSVLPIFTVLILLGWWNRHRRWGAFAWGLVGVCLGQIHVSGFFFAAGFAAWALLRDRKGVAWLSWLSGSCLGALPLIPWLQYVLAHLGDRRPHAFNWVRWFEFKFWVRWATEPLGLGLEYSLEPHFIDFLGYPLLGGRPTYLVLLLHLLIIGVGVVVLVGAGSRLWRVRHTWPDRWVGRHGPTALTQSAALWGFGILLTASGLAIHRHYMIVTFPLEFVWLARLALAHPDHLPGTVKRARSLLTVLWIAQFLVSVHFLGYIHVNRGAMHGDYGIAYGAQGRSPLRAP